MTEHGPDAPSLAQGRLRIIDALYGAVADPERWQEVVGAIAETFGGTVSLIYRPTATLDGQRLLANNLDPDFARSYEEYYGAINPLAQSLQGDRPPIHLNDGTVDASVLERSEFYTDWLRPLDIRFSFSLYAPLTLGDSVELVCVRPRRLGPITFDEGRMLEGLIPHLQRAVQLSRRLDLTEASWNASSSMLSERRTGMLLVDSDRHVVFMDPEAERIVECGDLAVRWGRVEMPPDLEPRFDAAVAQATGRGHSDSGRTGALMKVPRAGAPPLSVAISPLDERDRPAGSRGPLAIMVVTDAPRGRGFRSCGPGEP